MRYIIREYIHPVPALKGERMESAVNYLTICLVILLGTFFVFLIGCAFWARIDRFREELRYVNMELHRCPAGERSAWRRRRRRLWLRLFWLCR